MKEQKFSYKNYGKAFKQFAWFCEQVSKGLTVEIHHPKYVVMDRKRYEEVMRQAYSSQVQIIEEP